MEWSDVINDPTLQNLPFKIELNKFGKLLMSPATNKHGMMQGKLSRLIGNKYPEGEVITECSIQTPEGTKVADVVWASDAFIAEWGTVTPFPRAPELCVEIVSPSDSREEMRIKTELYLGAGAQEVWIVYLDSHMDVFNADGQVESSEFSEGIREVIFG
jgi:Uma2 family endonuclease